MADKLLPPNPLPDFDPTRAEERGGMALFFIVIMAVAGVGVAATILAIADLVGRIAAYQALSQ